MRRPLSIRARLTLAFVVSVGAVLAFTGFAIVTLVHRSEINSAVNQIDGVLAETQDRLETQSLPTRVLTLPTQGNVVVQVTNLIGTRVWAASQPLTGVGVVARASNDFTSSNGLALNLVTSARTRHARLLLGDGVVENINTSKGPGFIFGFVYDTPITHSETVLIASVAVSFPLLMLIAGVLIWLGVGFTLKPVEAIRRRVAAIAAEDLSERVPVTGGDDEIARLSRTLNGMLDRLEAASRFQQEFVSNASHELRSPLTTLLATVERARADPAGARWPEVGDAVVREGRRLEGIIDDLFWLARHDEHSIEVHREDVDLDDLLFEEAGRVRSVTDLAVDTSAVSPTRVVGDPNLYRRLTRNVVDNAVRYANAELRFDAHVDGDDAVVRVADDGDGLDVATSGRLFERFARSDTARSRRLGGTGLGLAIVAEVVALHGGSARFVESERGATIEIRVRREPPVAVG
ncbi:MAG TPA: ATP-binding protein [Acidimicrobiales bacterium]|nr:ATP-binding protein [Acidimicrobiales bacterium]